MEVGNVNKCHFSCYDNYQYCEYEHYFTVPNAFFSNNISIVFESDVAKC